MRRVPVPRGGLLNRPFAIAGIATAALVIGATIDARRAGESDRLTLSAVPAVAQTTGVTTQSCVDSALAPPLSIEERFYGNPKRDKLQLTVSVGALDPACAGLGISREINFIHMVKRFGWRPGTKTFRYATNEAATLEEKTRVKRYCNFSPAKTRADKIKRGYDNRYKAKRRVYVWLEAVSTDGTEIRQSAYFKSREKSMCQRRG